MKMEQQNSGIAIISDVHVYPEQEFSGSTLQNFFHHPLVQSASSIFLLGDIFDLLCGSHREYFSQYGEFFHTLKEAIMRGQRVYYFEGNHDFHLNKLFQDFIKRNNLPAHLLTVHKKALVTHLWGKKYYFSHGDEIDRTDYTYRLYRKCVRSVPLGLVANHLMPYSVLKHLGTKASTLSKQSRNYHPCDFTLLREQCRGQAIVMAQKHECDFIILGHHHIQEDYIDKTTPQQEIRYLNNGLATESRTFLYIVDNIPSFIRY